MKDIFTIKIVSQNWIKDDGMDDKNDLCSHGTVSVQMGYEVISSADSGNWTLTSTALLLMRSAFSDHKAGEMESQLLPCCGHFMCPNESGDNIIVMGCPSGIDWNVTHKENMIELKTEKNTVINVEIGEYSSIILNFVNEVERFYGDPEDKILPCDDDLTRDGFHLFWQNWRDLKSRLYNYY